MFDPIKLLQFNVSKTADMCQMIWTIDVSNTVDIIYEIIYNILIYIDGKMKNDASTEGFVFLSILSRKKEVGYGCCASIIVPSLFYCEISRMSAIIRKDQ